MKTNLTDHDSQRATNRLLPVDRRSSAVAIAPGVTVGKHEIRRWTGDHRGLVFRVSEGALWITQESDSQDVILRGGQSFRVKMKGTVVAEGLAERNRLEAN